MKQEQIIQTLADGGRIINNILLKPDRTPHKDRISDRQIQALEVKDLVQKIVGYDNTRTWQLKAAPCSNTQAAAQTKTQANEQAP